MFVTRDTLRTMGQENLICPSRPTDSPKKKHSIAYPQDSSFHSCSWSSVTEGSVGASNLAGSMISVFKTFVHFVVRALVVNRVVIVRRFESDVLGHDASPSVGDRNDVIDGIVHDNASTEITILRVVVVGCRVWRARGHAVDASVKVTLVETLRTVTMAPSAWCELRSCNRAISIQLSVYGAISGAKNLHRIFQIILLP